MLRGAFESREDEFTGRGVRPVVFDILGPDKVTSLLPASLKLVLHVNPSSMTPNYSNNIVTQATRSGWVEFHWGQNPTTISFDAATGGFVRPYAGYVGTSIARRDTLAYDRYLDLLALFHNNGSIYDADGKIVMQGYIQISFDGATYIGWFNSFTVTEIADKAYQFQISGDFTVDQELHAIRTTTLTSFANSGAFETFIEPEEDPTISPFIDPNEILAPEDSPDIILDPNEGIELSEDLSEPPIEDLPGVDS